MVEQAAGGFVLILIVICLLKMWGSGVLLGWVLCFLRLSLAALIGDTGIEAMLSHQSASGLFQGLPDSGHKKAGGQPASKDLLYSPLLCRRTSDIILVSASFDADNPPIISPV